MPAAKLTLRFWRVKLPRFWVGEALARHTEGQANDVGGELYPASS